MKINEADAIKAINSLRRIGNWELLSRLGQGGFGTVLKAQKRLVNGDLQLSAIKLINPTQMATDPDASRRFAHEYEMMRRLDSPYLSRLLDSGQEPISIGGQVTTLLWFATELIPGENLQEEISQHGILDKAQWLELAHDLLTAIAETHEKGVVHKDIKPSNIMRHARRSILVDFGIGSYVSVEDPGDEGGYTLGFCAPEQIDGKIDAADHGYEVDIFSAGSTLVYAAAGLIPWDIKESRTPRTSAEKRAMSLHRVQELYKDMKANPPRLSGLDHDQRELVNKMLVYSPEKRASAAELLSTVKALLPEGSLRRHENTNVRPVRSVPQVNRDWAAERKMGIKNKTAIQEGLGSRGPWPHIATTLLLTLLGPLGTGLRHSYLQQNPPSHNWAQVEKQLVATLFGYTSFGFATPFIAWGWFRSSRKFLDLLFGILSSFFMLGILVMFLIGISAGEDSDIYSLTTTSASIGFLAMMLLIPMVGFRPQNIKKTTAETLA